MGTQAGQHQECQERWELSSYRGTGAGYNEGCRLRGYRGNVASGRAEQRQSGYREVEAGKTVGFQVKKH